MLRWLLDAGPDVPLHVQSVFLGEMVSSPTASLMGPLSSLIINLTAICLQAGSLFQGFLCLELLLLAIRIAILRHAGRNAARGVSVPPDFYFILVISWCASQGALGFASMLSGIPTLQVLTVTSLMALVGPIGARNYSVPRFAMLLIGLVYLPLVIGAQFCGQPWLIVMVLQVPLLFAGTNTILKRYRDLSLDALLAKEDSHQRALRDSLTGLLNRAGLAHGLHGYDATREAFTIFCIDLDGFKPVNDKFGHWAGDLVLTAVAERLRSCSRKKDIVARVGGDEFVLVIPDLPLGNTEWFAEKLIRRITDEPYKLEAAGHVRIGASVGFVHAPDDGTQIDELQRKADAALYAAKRAGKGVSRRFGASADLGLGPAIDETVPVGSLASSFP